MKRSDTGAGTILVLIKSVLPAHSHTNGVSSLLELKRGNENQNNQNFCLTPHPNGKHKLRGSWRAMSSCMRLTVGRILLLRVVGAVMDGGREMLQELLRLQLEIRMQQPWNEGELFRRWCVDNIQVVRQFRFFKTTTKEAVDGVEVPKWDEADITLLSKMLSVIDENIYSTLRAETAKT